MVADITAVDPVNASLAAMPMTTSMTARSMRLPRLKLRLLRANTMEDASPAVVGKGVVAAAAVD